jgi:hypothetical protein
LDPKERNNTKYKLVTFTVVYRRLCGKDVAFEYPVSETAWGLSLDNLFYFFLIFSVARNNTMSRNTSWFLYHGKMMNSLQMLFLFMVMSITRKRIML